MLTDSALGGGRAALLLAATVVAGLQAGTYFAWASGVMPGLARGDDRTFVAATQQMNAAIVNPVFLSTFLGTPALAGACVVFCGPSARPWTITATVLSVGTLVVTFAGNIPLNEALDAAGAVDAIPDLAAVRAGFESAWNRWNLVRCLTSAGALASLAWALHAARG